MRPDWDASVEELEQTFIRIGHEVEEIIPIGPVSGPLTVGRVAEIEELTEFKKPIRACKVDVGVQNVDGEPRDIVCGATNFAVGDLVVVALPGTVLPGRLHHRHAQDLRPGFRRHDLLGIGNEPRCRPVGHPRAARGHRRTGYPGRRAPRPG